jgi:uncharacterized protein (TIGR00725 family)
MDNKHLKNNKTPKYRICISGAAETSHCGESAFSKAMELGKEVAKHNAVLVTGATTGFPFWTAKGAKEVGGIVIGFSPAVSQKEHIRVYKLPTEYHDVITYTGFGYSGRNLLLTRSSDAVIVGCGRIGTVNEFTIAFEDKKPIGVLEGEWELDDLIKELIAKGHRGRGKIVYSSDPKELVEKVIQLIDKERKTESEGSLEEVVLETHEGVE